jgi:hypothetical protein
LSVGVDGARMAREAITSVVKVTGGVSKASEVSTWRREALAPNLHFGAGGVLALPAELVGDLVRVRRSDGDVGSDRHDAFGPARKRSRGQPEPREGRAEGKARRTIA